MDLYSHVRGMCSWQQKRHANFYAALILKTQERAHIPSYPHSQRDYLEMKRKMEAIY